MAASMAVVLQDARSGEGRPFSPHPNDGAALAATLAGGVWWMYSTKERTAIEETNERTNERTDERDRQTDGSRTTVDGATVVSLWTGPPLECTSGRETRKQKRFGLY